MGGFAAAFIGVFIVGEDGGENSRTIAFRMANEARGRNQLPKLGARRHPEHNGQTTASSGGHELQQESCRGQ